MIVRAKKQQIVAGSVIVLFTLITFIVNNNNYKYWQSLAISEAPQWFTGVASVDNEYYLGGLEYLPVNVPSHHYIHERGDIVISKNEETVISNFTRKEGVTSFDIDIKNPSKLELPLVYYKGYEASYLDKKNGMPVTESENGLVQIEASKSGQIEVVYRWTATQQYSWYISILSTIGLIIYIFVSNRKRSDVNK